MAKFQPGQSGNAAGRPKGVPNRATVEVKELCKGIVDDPEYRSRLHQRALNGRLNPAVEAMIWHYAYGKPKDTVEQQGELRIICELPSDTR